MLSLYTKSDTIEEAKLRFKELSKFNEADHQALYFTARQDQYNLDRYQDWIDYSERWGNRLEYQLRYKVSDAIPLQKAVAKEQYYAVSSYNRMSAKECKINIPKVITAVITKFYAEQAIYPLPFPPGVPAPRFEGELVDPIGWKIHADDSLKQISTHLAYWPDPYAWVRMLMAKGWIKDKADWLKYKRYKMNTYVWHPWHC